MRISISNLSKTYPAPSEPLVVLDGINLELGSGKSLAIQGASGCGKSTFLHILGTLEEPCSGSVLLDGSDPFQLDDKALAAFRNTEIGFVFQDHYLLPQCTVLENVLLPTLAADVPGEEPESVALELLERVGLSARIGHLPSELSGGERQRAAIARALVRRPGLVLCDEPTGNLDSDTAEMVADLFVELHSTLASTLVVVTHSARLASRFQRRVTFSGRSLQEAGK